MAEKIQPTDPRVPDSPRQIELRPRMMELRNGGMSATKIAKEVGIPVGTAKVWLTKWQKIEAMERKRVESSIENADDSDGEDDDSRDGEEQPTRNGKGLDTSGAERRLESAITAAARTVAKAAKGVKIESQSLQAAKLLLKKYGLLQEEEYAKESQYVKMENGELCERALAAVEVLMRRRGQDELAVVIGDAIGKIKGIVALQAQKMNAEAQ